MEEVSDDGDNVCPLCMEEMDLTDKQLKACRCGYEICVWCWHHIMEMAEKDNIEGRCPACRMPYDKERIVGMTVNCERLTDSNSEKRQKAHRSKPKASEGRKHLSNVRVIQRNLVYVVGIPASLADEKILERREFFGQYGKILKVSVSRSSSHNSQHSTSGPTSSVYITFVREEDAFRCIQAVNGYALEGRPLRACFGTTKYCYAWLKNMPCSNPDCLYLHDIGTQEDSFTKEEMVSKCGSKTQQFHDLTNPSQQRWGYCLPPPAAAAEVSCPTSTSSSKSSAKTLVSSIGSQTRTMPANGTTGKSNVLPASASWASHVAQEKTLPVRTPPLLGSGNSKSNSSRALSVSPPSNLPTSAAVVAAAARPGLTCDQGKPSSVAVSGNALHSSGQSSSFISAKQSCAKHHVSIGADTTLNARVKASAATATPEIYTSRTVFSGKETSGINSNTKFGIHEGLERRSKNLSSNMKQELSELGSVHECKMVENEGTDSVSVSSSILCGELWKDGVLNSVSQCTNESNASVVNNSAFDSCVNETQHSLPFSNSCADLLQKYGMSCSESSLVESMKELGMTSSEDSSCLSDCKEQSTDLFVKQISESARKPQDTLDVAESNGVSDSQMPTYVDEVEGSADVATLTNGSAAMSLNVGDLSINLHTEPLNNGIIQGDHDGIGSTDHEIKDGSGSSAANTTVDSIQSSTQESLLDTAEQSVRIPSRVSEHLDIATDSDIRTENSEYLDRMKNNIVQEEKMVDTDVGESSIIANILSMNFDISENVSLASPHNLAKLLLSEKDTSCGFSMDLSSSWKPQNSKQSRFLFARQEDSKEGSDVSSVPSLTSTSQLQRELSNGKDVLGDRNEYDQVNKLSNDVSASNVNEYQTIYKGDTPHISLEATVMQPLVSRSLYSPPPGFSVPNRMPSVPPPGFCSQTKIDRPYEQTTAFTDGNQVPDNSNMYLSAYNHTHLLANSASNDVEFIDPAIMVVGKGKLPMASSQPGSMLHDSNFTGLLQHSLSNANVGHALRGFGTPFSQQLNPIDYDGRQEIFKQRAFCTNSSLASSRQQLQFPDQVGDTFSSYLSSQNDAVLHSRMMGNTQANFNALFCQQPANSLLRSSPTYPNGWSNWNRMNSAVESPLITRRMEPGIADITSNERIGSMDSKVGWMRMLPSYNDAKFHKPNSDDFYSRIVFDM